MLAVLTHEENNLNREDPEETDSVYSKNTDDDDDDDDDDNKEEDDEEEDDEDLDAELQAELQELSE